MTGTKGEDLCSTRSVQAGLRLKCSQDMAEHHKGRERLPDIIARGIGLYSCCKPIRPVEGVSGGHLTQRMRLTEGS
jgi:hypothetical protein